MTQASVAKPDPKPKPKIAHILLDGETREVRAGPTLVSELKAQLGLDPATVLFLIKGRKRRPLADHEKINVKDGLQFEAVRGGGVS